MKYIYLRFTNMKSWDSYIIRWCTGTWTSHVEFVIDNKRIISSELPLGVILKSPEVVNREEFFKVNVTEEQHKIILDTAMEQVGKKYDILALIGILFRRNWQKTDKWFCSELIAYCFMKSGKPLLNYIPNWVTPLDILKSPLLEKTTKEDAYSQ